MIIKLRDIQLNDLEQYLVLNNPKNKFHKFNWPYFEKQTEIELKEYVNHLHKKILNNKKEILENKKLIVSDTGEILWEVNWYWKSEETLWMEAGIVIFEEKNWGKWIWKKAFKIWIDELFTKNPKIIRLWLTTWSWNFAMLKLAEKLGFKKEAEYRKARIVDWNYYDSISYWVLREEWI